MLNGAKIRELREQKGDTTEKFGLAVGLSDTMISFIENDLKSPSVEKLKLIAEYLGVAVDDLYV